MASFSRLRQLVYARRNKRHASLNTKGVNGIKDLR